VSGRLWFYVPNYPAAKAVLEAAYLEHGVVEWSCEPGEVRNQDDGADVVVLARSGAPTAFRAWLESSGIKGLRIEGRTVKR
jgi:hypothetical protein